MCFSFISCENQPLRSQKIILHTKRSHHRHQVVDDETQDVEMLNELKEHTESGTQNPFSHHLCSSCRYIIDIKVSRLYIFSSVPFFLLLCIYLEIHDECPLVQGGLNLDGAWLQSLST